MKKERNFWLFNIKAKNSIDALKKARKEVKGYGDVVYKVRLVNKKYPKDSLKVYSAYGGKR